MGALLKSYHPYQGNRGYLGETPQQKHPSYNT